MSALYPTSRRSTPDGGHILLLAALFWLFTYALLSVRAETIMGDGFLLLTGRRFASVTVGAGLFWLALERTRRLGSTHWSSSLVTLAMIVPASLVLLLARLLWEAIVPAAPLSFEANLRWVLLWSGYFGLWLCAYQLFQLHGHLRSGRVASLRSAPVAAPAIDASSQAVPVPDDAMLDWAAQMIVREIESAASRDLRKLAEQLRQRAGYESADPLNHAHNDRIRMMHRVAEQLERALPSDVGRMR